MAAPKSYKGWPMPSFLNEEGAKLFTELELEESDVLMVSNVKAGTTWVNKIIHCLLRMDEKGELQELPNDHGKSGQVYPEWLPAKKPEDPEWPGVGPGGMVGKIDFDDLCAMPKPRIFSTHCGAQELLPASLMQRGRLVYVLRNPKDVLNSLHYFRGEAKDGWLGNEHGPGSLERFLTGVNSYGSYFDHVLSMESLLEGPVAERSLIVYYEDLKGDVVQGIQALAKFLGITLTEAKLQKVVETTSFESMSSGSIGKMAGMLCRKGITQDWKNAPLGKEEWSRFDAVFEEKVGMCSMAHPSRPWVDLERTVELRVSAGQEVAQYVAEVRSLMDNPEEDRRIGRVVVAGLGAAAGELARGVCEAVETEGIAKKHRVQTREIKDGLGGKIPLLTLELKKGGLRMATIPEVISAATAKYFEVWNAHNVDGLKALFAPDVQLRDWDQAVSGAEAVADANGGIFKAVPKIQIEVLTTHVSPSTSSAACEILVKLNNEAAEVLKVVDIITFTADGKIKSVIAYKG